MLCAVGVLVVVIVWSFMCTWSCVSGGRVPLHGFKGFLGGLDNERDLTGELSVYTKFEELEIMFHVSTLLPFSPKDTQQVRR